MTVASTLNKKQYQGNSLTTEFPLPFHVTAKEHIFALLKKGTSIEEIKNNFAVDLERKVFIYPLEGEPLKNDESLTVYRKIPLTQIVDLENAGAFHPEVLEYDGFDRIVMQIQQLDEEISRALKIDMTDTRDVSNLLEELFAAREEAVLHAQKALEQAKTAAEKAEKTEHWARYSEEKVQELTDLQVQCFISNDGQGHVSYTKDEHKLEIVLPFDNAGLNHPKMVLSDSIDLARSDIGASAKAVQSLHAKMEQDTAKLQADKLDKSAISSVLDSESEETVASSKAVNDLRLLSPELSMPSDNYIEYGGIGENDTVYTAPANGYCSYVVAAGNSTTTKVSVLNITQNHLSVSSYCTSGQNAVLVPIKKGAQFQLRMSYSGSITSVERRFYYAEGEIR